MDWKSPRIAFDQMPANLTYPWDRCISKISLHSLACATQNQTLKSQRPKPIYSLCPASKDRKTRTTFTTYDRHISQEHVIVPCKTFFWFITWTFVLTFVQFDNCPVMFMVRRYKSNGSRGRVSTMIVAIGWHLVVYCFSLLLIWSLLWVWNVEFGALSHFKIKLESC